ncbi:MAG: hypothetical protein GX852_05125 [Clostridiales bacterium]|nr:hypothetical protein [Clostridiales bacterium]
MEKSRKLTAVYALIMDLPLSIIITVIALLLAGNLTMQSFFLNFAIAYVLTFLINMFIPAPKWGFNFAIKHSKPGTFKFGLLLNLVVAFVFVVILDLIMTAVGVLLFGHGSFAEYMVAVLGGFIPCYVPTLIIAMLWNGVSDNLSRAICKEPVMHNEAE